MAKTGEKSGGEVKPMGVPQVIQEIVAEVFGGSVLPPQPTHSAPKREQ